MCKRNFVMTVLVVVGLAIAAVVSAGMHSQRKGMSCMGDMMGMEGREESGEMEGMEGMAGMGKEEMRQHALTKDRKKVGEQFICPVDGMRLKVTENTPATEYRGKTYYFCNEQDKQTFLQDPERYAKEQSAK